MGKIIFFTSVSVFNHFNLKAVPDVIQKEKTRPVVSKKMSGKAFYHSGKLLDKVLNDFSENQIEIIMVSPVVVLNNSLINKTEATLAGLRYMFRHNIEHDNTFQRLVRRKLMKTMINVNDLPHRVFDSIESYRENIQIQKLPESIKC